MLGGMHRRTGVILAVLGGVIVAAVLAVLLLPRVGGAPLDSAAAPSTAGSPSAAAPTDPPPTETVEPSADPTPGVYASYSDRELAQAQGRILLFFHAPWCPQCRSLERDILADGVPEGVTILKVDYDSRQDLRQRYGVTQQTSFVEVDASGQRVQPNFVAYSDPHLASVVDEYL